MIATTAQSGEGTMGEIRVEVKLTNAIDEGNARRRTIAEDEVRRCHATAMVDTGAVRSILPVQLVEQLGIQIRGNRVAEYADGRNEVVGVTEPIIFEIMGRDTLEEALVLGNEVLIGQTVLEKLDLLADCANQRLIPNPEHPTQPVCKIR